MQFLACSGSGGGGGGGSGCYCTQVNGIFKTCAFMMMQTANGAKAQPQGIYPKSARVKLLRDHSVYGNIHHAPAVVVAMALMATTKLVLSMSDPSPS